MAMLLLTWRCVHTRKSERLIEWHFLIGTYHLVDIGMGSNLHEESDEMPEGVLVVDGELRHCILQCRNLVPPV